MASEMDPEDTNETKNGIDRRAFLKGAAAASAAAALAGTLADTVLAQTTPPSGGGAAGGGAAGGGAAGASAGGSRLSTTVIGRPGSDFMVDVIKALGIDYVAANPGSSFRSLQESIVNYGGNSAPEFITCMHEESSVALAHGYAKAAGKPMMVLAHATVGLQHAAMGVYNAWCDRVPVLLVAGNILDVTKRRQGVEWYHTAQDPAALLRDMIKWDDQPMSLQGFAESMVRAYKISTTPPMEPVLVIADGALQEGRVESESSVGGWQPLAAALESSGLAIPQLVRSIPPQGDSNALRDAARMLAAAKNPVILVDRGARTPAGLGLMVQLAETLGAPVVDLGGRMNMPNTHFANLSGLKGQLVRNADVILALEVADLWGQLNSVGDPLHEYSRVAKADVKVIHINLSDMYTKSNYQDFERFQAVDLPINGDVEASLPTLIDALQSALGSSNGGVATRTDQMKTMFQQQQREVRTTASYGWDASPVTTARLAAETWNVLKDENWSLSTSGLNGWPRRLWKITEFGQMLGGSGGSGEGYSSPAAVGAALANKAKGMITVNFNGDGDLMYAPGVLWTAAHHKVPLLSIIFNNHGYHQEMMHLQNMAALHGRDMTTAPIGTAITGPNIDYAKLAQSMGWWAMGPIDDPSQLNSVLSQALEVVKGCSPAMVDVSCQPR